MRHVLALLLSIACAAPAAAGAWLRDAGTGFTATTAALRWNPDGTVTQETGFFAEYGLRPRLTLGVDMSGDNVSGGSGALFAVLPVGRIDGPLRMSVDLGLGGRQAPGGIAPFGRIGFAIGTGWAGAGGGGTGGGWASARLSAEFAEKTPTLVKLDAIYGRDLGPRVKAMIGLEVSHVGDFTSGALLPALSYELKEGRALFVALEARRTAGTAYGIRAGFWNSF
jgi:hypothetical protein